MADSDMSAIIRVLTESPRKTLTRLEIMKKIGLGKSIVNSLLYKLKSEGRAKKIEDSPPKWQLCDHCDVPTNTFVKRSSNEGSTDTSESWCSYRSERTDEEHSSINSQAVDVLSAAAVRGRNASGIDNEKEILALLQHNPDAIGTLAIAKLVGKTRKRDVNKFLYKLKNQGLIKQVCKEPPFWQAEETKYFDSYYKKFFTEKGPLGSGGFGVVFLAEHKLDRRDYAIKRIKIDEGSDKECFKEVQIMCDLIHENIVCYRTSWFDKDFEDWDEDDEVSDISSQAQRVSLAERVSNSVSSEPSAIQHHSASADTTIQPEAGDTGKFLPDDEKGHCSANVRKKKTDGADGKQKLCMFLCIQMDKCDTTLAEVLHNRNAVDVQYNHKILSGMLSGVEYLHSKKVYHRDIKPPNILLKMSAGVPIVKITDFGLSFACLPGGVEAKSDVGSPMYRAPEIGAGNTYAWQVDIFSIGVIWFEMFCMFGSEHERRNELMSLRNPKDRFRNIMDWFCKVSPKKTPWDTTVNILITCFGPAENRPNATDLMRHLNDCDYSP